MWTHKTDLTKHPFPSSFHVNPSTRSDKKSFLWHVIWNQEPRPVPLSSCTESKNWQWKTFHSSRKSLDSIVEWPYVVAWTDTVNTHSIGRRLACLEQWMDREGPMRASIYAYAYVFMCVCACIYVCIYVIVCCIYFLNLPILHSIILLLQSVLTYSIVWAPPRPTSSTSLIQLIPTWPCSYYYYSGYMFRI